MAARYDWYETEVVSDFVGGFQVIDPTGVPPSSFNLSEVDFTGKGLTLGIRYAPLDDVTLRASLATGIKPPTLRELQPFPQNDTFLFLTDPQRGNVPQLIGPLDVVRGGNPDLGSEESETFSLGAILEPRFAPGLRISIDYVLIEKEGEVAGISDQFLLDNEGQFPGRVIRGALEPDAPPEFTAGPIELFNVSQLNRAFTTVEAIDLAVQYGYETANYGRFDLDLSATHNLSLERQDTPDADPIENVDFFGGPIEWLAITRLDWEKDSWRAGWVGQYVHSYSVLSITEAQRDDLRELRLRLVGRDRVPSQWFHDAYVGYNFASTGIDVSVTVRNIFDQYELLPSSFPGSAGFAPPVDPRLRTYVLSVRKQF